MMRPEARDTFFVGKPNRAEIEALATDPSRLLALMDAEGIERVGLINYVSPDVIGLPHEANDWLLHYASADRRRLIAFGSVNPRFTPDVRAAASRLVDAGASMFKVHPLHQGFSANAYLETLPSLAQLYEVAQAARIPLTVHTGTSIFPGARNKFGNPLDLDDVAVDFPALRILLAHGGRPLWMDEAFFLVRRHPNVLLEISGIPPVKLLEYFPRLEEIADKVIWGTDWPSPGVRSMRGNADAFLSLPLGEDTKRKILHDNAAALLG